MNHYLWIIILIYSSLSIWIIIFIIHHYLWITRWITTNQLLLWNRLNLSGEDLVDPFGDDYDDVAIDVAIDVSDFPIVFVGYNYGYNYSYNLENILQSKKKNRNNCIGMVPELPNLGLWVYSWDWNLVVRWRIPQMIHGFKATPMPWIGNIRNVLFLGWGLWRSSGMPNGPSPPHSAGDSCEFSRIRTAIEHLLILPLVSCFNKTQAGHHLPWIRQN